MNLAHKQRWRMTYWIVAFAIGLFLIVIVKLGFSEDSVKLNIRLSAKISLICFCLAFSASSAYATFQNKVIRWLLKHRKYIGVAFALVHFIHLLFLILLQVYFHPVFIVRPPLLIGLGGFAYLTILAMLLTSFDRFSGLISRAHWQRLHKYGGYWILIVFSNSIFTRVILGQWVYVPFAFLLLFVWIIRIVARTKNRSLRTKAS